MTMRYSLVSQKDMPLFNPKYNFRHMIKPFNGITGQDEKTGLISFL